MKKTKKLVNLLKLMGPNPLKKEYKKSLKLSQEQKSILVGTLLGDAHLEPSGIKEAYSYYFGKVDQEVYVKHIYNLFQDLCSAEPCYISGTSFYFRTCTHPSFNFYAHQFYEINDQGKRIKKVPKLLHK